VPRIVAAPMKLIRDEELVAGLTRVAGGRAEAAIGRLRSAAASEADTAKAIHGARKDLKKLRAVLRLLRDELGKDTYRRENARFRDAGRALSQARDAEVKLQTLNALAERAEGLPAEAVEGWRKILVKDRDAAANLARGPALAEATGLIEEGLRSIRGWELEGDSWGAVDGALTRTHRRGRRAMKAAAKAGTEDDFHEWRKRAKDLWYELRLLEKAWPRPLTATVEEVHQLTELLGAHHDQAVLREDLRQRRLGKGETRTLEEAISRFQTESAGKAIKLGKRVYAKRPTD